MANTHINHPRIPVYSNVDGKRYKGTQHIRAQLPKQLYRPVRWEQTMHCFYERPKGEEHPWTYAIGPGRSLKTLLKMVNLKAADRCLTF